MKPVNVSMSAERLTAVHRAPAVRGPNGMSSPAPRELDVAMPIPTELAAEPRISAAPPGVSNYTWEMLKVNVVDAQRRSAAAFAPLRESVKGVVRELRAAHQTWEQVYAVLTGVVTPATERPVSFAMEYEMHFSRSGTLVAHMHSWADVERLAEIEAEAHAG